jgi:CO dehydrogenase nickel-insertion accessory protein CooC1
MVGLQGSGKTTTTAKLAKRLKDSNGKKVLMASLDTNRPAAMEQLAILGTQIGVDTCPSSRAKRRSRSPSGRRPRPSWAAMTCCSWIPPAACTSTKC